MGENKVVEQGAIEEEHDAPFPLTERDKFALDQKDEDFELHTWDELEEAISTNKLDILTRKPSDLRRYLTWCWKIHREYGSISNYIIQHRLPWGSPPFEYISPIPFAEVDDYKILINDWPYGFTKDITHIVVWSKTPIPTDEETGDLTSESRKILQEFVDRTFVDRLDGSHERVLWFKNWVKLQSVRALEHMHVLVRNASEEDLEHWTGRKLE
ncbi:hypothetical protein G7Y89_g14845 [Cudoniella acicularis]|uniref:N-acetylglucosamine-induced protein 1 n=1 Tax=Cudoniella acicularis TaxID=354080 RepID=A0A8H4VQV3_9HELO|nr:hypothetical protein G7Y89_g14845 [Cudoniella acicularis]